MTPKSLKLLINFRKLVNKLVNFISLDPHALQGGGILDIVGSIYGNIYKYIYKKKKKKKIKII
jgi:hypothetical protein